MCQARPGNRCSPHAKERLVKNAQRLKAVLDSANVTHPDYLTGPMRVRYNKVSQELQNASENYDATTQGLKELDDRISSAQLENNPELVDKLEARKEHAKNLRERRQEAYRLSNSLKVTAERRADNLRADDELLLRDNINNSLEGYTEGTEQYKIIEKETLDSMYRDAQRSVVSAKDFVAIARKDFADKVDAGHGTSSVESAFKDAYTSLHRSENRRDALKQMRYKVSQGIPRYGINSE